MGDQAERFKLPSEARPFRWKRLVTAAAVSLLAGSLVIAALLFFAQRSLLFQPPARAEFPAPEQGALLCIPGPADAPEVVATWSLPSGLFVPIEGGHHNDLFVAHGRQVWPQIGSFLLSDR